MMRASTELPHITVATVVARDDRFLIVEEHEQGRLVYNQPAGHVENGESLVQAAQRETLEETAWEVEITDLVGIYSYSSPVNGISYVRHCFAATPIKNTRQELDSDISAAHWLTKEELLEREQNLRSPLVLSCLNDWLAGSRYPLALIRN